MKKINIILLGYGRVGKAFARLIQEKQDICLSQYKLHIRIGLVLNSRGGLILEELPKRRPGLGYTHQALDRGLHVVTANKGPVALHSLAGSEIHRIEGILNGTTNYILTRMGEGEDYTLALEEAQQKGIAEPDPSQDVGGWDTAAKILIITNATFGRSFTLKDVHVEGITNIPLELREKARETGKVIKLIGRFIQNNKQPLLETKLSLIDCSHPLYGVDGAQKGITFFTDTMDSVTVTGGKSNPKGAAAALLKDIITIFYSRRKY